MSENLRGDFLTHTVYGRYKKGLPNETMQSDTNLLPSRHAIWRHEINTINTITCSFHGIITYHISLCIQHTSSWWATNEFELTSARQCTICQWSAGLSQAVPTDMTTTVRLNSFLVSTTEYCSCLLKVYLTSHSVNCKWSWPWIQPLYYYSEWKSSFSCIMH